MPDTGLSTHLASGLALSIYGVLRLVGLALFLAVWSRHDAAGRDPRRAIAIGVAAVGVLEVLLLALVVSGEVANVPRVVSFFDTRLANTVATGTALPFATLAPGMFALITLRDLWILAAAVTVLGVGLLALAGRPWNAVRARAVWWLVLPAFALADLRDALLIGVGVTHAPAVLYVATLVSAAAVGGIGLLLRRVTALPAGERVAGAGLCLYALFIASHLV